LYHPEGLDVTSVAPRARRCQPECALRAPFTVAWNDCSRAPEYALRTSGHWCRSRAHAQTSLGLAPVPARTLTRGAVTQCNRERPLSGNVTVISETGRHGSGALGDFELRSGTTHCSRSSGSSLWRSRSRSGLGDFIEVSRSRALHNVGNRIPRSAGGAKSTTSHRARDFPNVINIFWRLPARASRQLFSLSCPLGAQCCNLAPSGDPGTPARRRRAGGPGRHRATARPVAGSRRWSNLSRPG